MINIVCVLRNGGKVGYNPTWVEKLKNSVQRNLTIEHNFICFSDCDVPCNRIPLDPIDYGFWSKMQMFKPGIFKDPVLYIDLDTVICQNIDDIIHAVKDQKFVMWYDNDKKVHSSACMYWNGDYSFLWELYKSKPLSYWKNLYHTPLLYGDQAIISENTDHTLFSDVCPAEWFSVASTKNTQNNFSNVKILIFRKARQKPSTMLDHCLVQQHWV